MAPLSSWRTHSRVDVPASGWTRTVRTRPSIRTCWRQVTDAIATVPCPWTGACAAEPVAPGRRPLADGAVTRAAAAGSTASPVPRASLCDAKWNAIRVPGDVDRDGPRTAVALPVRAHGHDLGHFLLVFPSESFGLRASVDVKHAAIAVADQLGMALLRYRRP